MILKPYLVVASALFSVSPLMTVGTTWAMEQEQARDIIQDQQGNQFYIYKVSGAGLKCGYRIFNIEPKDMVNQLLDALNQEVTFLEDGEYKVKTVRDLIIDDMANNGIDMPETKAHEVFIGRQLGQNFEVSDADLKDYLISVYLNGAVGSGEVSNLLIPAVAYIVGINVDFYNNANGILRHKYKINSIHEGMPHISFFNTDHHFDRLIPVAGAPAEELESAKFSEKIYNYFKDNERYLDFEDFNQLVPKDIKSSPEVSPEMQMKDSQDRINTIIANIDLPNEDLIFMGFSKNEIDTARGFLASGENPPQQVEAPQGLDPEGMAFLKVLIDEGLSDSDLIQMKYDPADIKHAREH